MALARLAAGAAAGMELEAASEPGAGLDMSSDSTWPGRGLTLNSWRRNDRPPRRYLRQSHRGFRRAQSLEWIRSAIVLRTLLGSFWWS